MCYVGKATKIFIFIVTVLVVLGLVLGLGILRHHHHTTANEFSDGSCSRLPPHAISAPNFNSPTPPSSFKYHPTPPTISLTNPTPPHPSDANPSSLLSLMQQSPPPPPEETALPNPPSVAGPPINRPTLGLALVAQALVHVFCVAMYL
ncbi:hypothetical protein LR48_Vigan03g314600 [Vigna angularis]|uniref:Uncharacterized protein n=1 Tax=Phaseolus angularis TaxID=3914 RepID=A0A0L9UB51_PHAAN|nr:proline-rich receptor-like protein kinase PERK9 [Vigna angularis]KAG2376630.1 uncharacterized protein HKW66_Vig0242600 [Vigna angularis]KOM39764.1 hypothetical protein LR48_Vigan03g314600 [Vigna angularis]